MNVLVKEQEVEYEVQKLTENEEVERNHIIRPDAVIYPRTMVVKFVNASVAVVAVTTLFVFLNAADGAEGVLVFGLHEQLVEFCRGVLFEVAWVHEGEEDCQDNAPSK